MFFISIHLLLLVISQMQNPVLDGIVVEHHRVNKYGIVRNRLGQYHPIGFTGRRRTLGGFISPHIGIIIVRAKGRVIGRE